MVQVEFKKHTYLQNKSRPTMNILRKNMGKTIPFTIASKNLNT
jgi:hypothetical protein